jgi:uncharacterized protein involved in response to NO
MNDKKAPLTYSNAAPPARHKAPILLAHGFRPFFLLAGVWAIAPLLLVAWTLSGGSWPSDGIAIFTWHGHEMIFGFVAAAIAGFLLTAVPSWTGTQAVSGYALAVLVAVWMSGRILALPFFEPTGVGLQLLAIGFFPALAIAVAGPLIRKRNFRNLPFLVFLSLLFAAEVAFNAPRFGWAALPQVDGLRLAVNTVLMMVTIVGGRIVPAFTKNAFSQMRRAVTIKSSRWIEVSAVASVVAVLLGDLFARDTPLAGTLAATAAVLLALRMRGWCGWQTFDVPLLWVLHLGYSWLIVGLALKAAWLLGGFGWAIHWMHALTAGAFGTMILGVTTRAALGHTGRALAVSGHMSVAYLSVSFAAALRVWGPGLAPDRYALVLSGSILLWVAAFGLFLWAYIPILMRPRVDGLPG